MKRIPPLLSAQAHRRNDDISICGRASRIALKDHVGAGETPHRLCAHGTQSLVVDVGRPASALAIFWWRLRRHG
jgi:hypothetical protein